MENSSPEEHVVYVWDNFISKSSAKNIFFVAHSYGGLSFVELMIQREAEVKSKVCAVALTDSVHNVWHQEAGKSILEWMQEVRLLDLGQVQKQFDLEIMHSVASDTKLMARQCFDDVIVA
ncbi:Protein FAM172A [Acipenser ruthenus]|uniref:Protein FAM172A n=1 Tax=Acipenser ruthenus TaxID=7906 RepID=A0A662YL80_ACIRT|nr:Protein FAM172A [Acipenser ruthenus]